MDILDLDGWVIRYDRRFTEQAYSLANLGAHACRCAYCRNYVTLRDAAYGSAFGALLAQLGIDPHKEAELSEAGQAESGGHLYTGFYHFAGIIDQDPGDRMTRVQSGDDESAMWQIFFTPDRALVAASFGNSPIVQLEFQVELPWVVAERTT